MKRLILWAFALVLVGVPAALLALAILGLDDQPSIVRPVEVGPEQTARAKRILAAHDPRTTPPGVLQTFSVAAEDLDLALNFLLAQHGGGARVELQPGAVTLWASIEAPPNPFGAYINVEAVARQSAGLPVFDRLRIGRVPVPPRLADWALAYAMARLSETDAGTSAADLVEAVRIDGSHVEVEYRWRTGLQERLRNVLLPPAEQERLREYQQRLAALTADPNLPRQVPVLDLLTPMMQHAATRPAADAVAENRAALLVLAFYVNGRGLGSIVPGAREWPRARPHRVTLAGRTDMAQHFVVSAALAATAGSPLADAIGVYKEVADTREGSGFSFADLAADRAGTVFGQHATRSADAARALQRRVADGIVEADFMPPASDLPDMMAEAEFKRRFGGVGEPRYRQMMAEIERRLSSLALYR